MIDLRQGSQDEWLSLREASEKMGVSGATLRAWADQGRVEAYRTPGGHRRFRVTAKGVVTRSATGQGDMRRRLLEHAALGSIRLLREREDVLKPNLPPQAYTELRELERALVQVVTFALSERVDEPDARASSLGQLFGKWNWRYGVGVREAQQIVGTLRRAFSASVVEFAFGVGEPNPDELNGWLNHAHEIIDRVNVSMLEYRSEEPVRQGGSRSSDESRASGGKK